MVLHDKDNTKTNSHDCDYYNNLISNKDRLNIFHKHHRCYLYYNIYNISFYIHLHYI